MTCLDCGLDICVLKEIELTGGCVSMQWARWTLSPPSYQPSPRLSPVMLPGHFVSVFMSRSGQEWHGHKDILNTCLRKPERSIRVQLFCMQTWAFFFFFSHHGFSPLFTWLHLTSLLWLSKPLLSHSPLIFPHTWLLVCSSPASALSLSPYPPLSVYFLQLACGSFSPLSCSSYFFLHFSSMLDCKHKAHNCSLWPFDFQVIAMMMLAGLLMSPVLSLCPRLFWIQNKRKQINKQVSCSHSISPEDTFVSLVLLFAYLIGRGKKSVVILKKSVMMEAFLWVSPLRVCARRNNKLQQQPVFFHFL